MWKEKLGEIISVMKMYGEKINNGASEEEIQRFTKRCIEELNVKLPQEYICTLKYVNGIEFNGFILYGIDENLLNAIQNQHINGLIQFNKIWYENEWQKPYIFFGEDNISWYVYDLEDGKYYKLDNPSGRVVEEYTNFNNMLYNLLSDSLM